MADTVTSKTIEDGLAQRSCISPTSMARVNRLLPGRCFCVEFRPRRQGAVLASTSKASSTRPKAWVCKSSLMPPRMPLARELIIDYGDTLDFSDLLACPTPLPLLAKQATFFSPPQARVVVTLTLSF